MDWIELALAMGLFMASHRIPAALGLKARAEALLGPRGYTAAFSLVSLGLLGWLIAAAGQLDMTALQAMLGG